jgi:hypothetical protein
MSHGTMASGIKNTVELITGTHENLISYDAYVDGHNDVKKFISDLLEKHVKDEIILVTDVLGGSVNNEALMFNSYSNVYVISGMNAPLVINLIISDEVDTRELIQQSIFESKDMIQFLQKVEANGEEDF